MKNVAVLAKLALLAATLIWGASFVVLKNTIADIPIFFLLTVRFTLAALLLAAVFYKKLRLLDLGYVLRGLCMGILLFSAYIAQTYGLMSTTPGKNAFLTAVYCVIVPFLNWFIIKKKPDIYNLAAAFLCIAGVGLVSLRSVSSVGSGDLLTLVGGFFFAAHIIAVSSFVKNRDVILLTLLQFFFCGMISLVLFFITRETVPVLTSASIASLAYLTVLATAACLLFQSYGQKHTAPAPAALLLSLEAVFGVIFSIIFYGERLSLQLIIGFALIFTAVIISETKLSFIRLKKYDEAATELVKK